MFRICFLIHFSWSESDWSIYCIRGASAGIFNSPFGISFNSIYHFYVFTAYLYSPAIKSTFDSNFFLCQNFFLSFLPFFLSLPIWMTEHLQCSLCIDFTTVIYKIQTVPILFDVVLVENFVLNMKVFFITHVFGMCLVPCALFPYYVLCHPKRKWNDEQQSHLHG